jgi:hypothetical protein
VTCIVLAGVFLIASFSQPTCLLAVMFFGAYAYYLYRGGRDFTADMGEGRVRARAWLIWGGIGTVALITGFTWTPALLIAGVAGGYAIYLFTGGRDVTRESKHGIKRSAVWLYYFGIAVLATCLGFTHPASFVVAAVAAAYSAYLYRGGRWVFWIW